MARSDWAALLAAAVQIAYRHDTRPFLPLAKGLARQTMGDTGAVRDADEPTLSSVDVMMVSRAQDLG